MNNILYLDFDGVLHHHFVLAGPGVNGDPYLPQELVDEGFSLFQYAHYLKVPDNIDIVLSTSWANNRGSSTNWAKKWLPPHLADKVVGRTKDVYKGSANFNRLPRGLQVLSHAKQFGVTNYLAIDDNDNGFDRFGDKYIKTDDTYGIIPVVEQINEKLTLMSLHAQSD